jgi:hypothetical protein
MQYQALQNGTVVEVVVEATIHIQHTNAEVMVV